LENYQSQIRQDLGVFFTPCQQVVTSGAIVGDPFSIRADMAAVVAAETARSIVVPQVVGMHAPGHFHFRENIPEVDPGDGVRRLLHQRTA
jgi:hypothetical protein